MELSNYETVFILTPVLSEVQMKDAVEKFKKVLVDNKAKVIHEENWGLRKLAYPIQHKSTGFYLGLCGNGNHRPSLSKIRLLFSDFSLSLIRKP